MLPQEQSVPRVLVVAGSDSGGGAGIQADIKTIVMLGGYAATAITALTAQNTLGVLGVVPVDPGFVAEQMLAVLSDIGADAIKIGMLHSAATIRAVAQVCERYRRIPVILDPVMVAKGGAPLIEREARSTLLDRLVPISALITPNVPEATALTGITINHLDDVRRATDQLILAGAEGVLIKGGHLPGDPIVDLLRSADGEEHSYSSARQNTRSTHGTGCTLASAIATGIAEGLTLSSAVGRAHRYVSEAIRTAFPLGRGHGPLNHAHPLSELAAAEDNAERHLTRH